MKHLAACKIFEDIRNEPYLVSTSPMVEAPNCYFKGIRLIKELAQLGYAVKGHVADIDWADTPVPDEIVNLRPKDFPSEQHFYLSVLIDGVWRVIDPSIDPQTATLGFRMVEFEGDARTCFDLQRKLSQKEQIEVFQKMADIKMIEDYFQKNAVFLQAINEWLEKSRS